MPDTKHTSSSRTDRTGSSGPSPCSGCRHSCLAEGISAPLSPRINNRSLRYWLHRRLLWKHSGRHHAHELGKLVHERLRIHPALLRVVARSVLVVCSLRRYLDRRCVVVGIVVTICRGIHCTLLTRHSEDHETTAITHTGAFAAGFTELELLTELAFPLGA